jgi:multidrug efflux pump subunit AcrB
MSRTSRAASSRPPPRAASPSPTSGPIRAQGISFNVQVQIPEERTQIDRGPWKTSRCGPTTEAVLLRNIANIEQGTAVGTYERYNMVRVVSITANIHGTDFGRAIKAVRKAIAEVGPAPDGKTKVDLRGQVVPFNQLYEGFSSGLSSPWS